MRNTLDFDTYLKTKTFTAIMNSGGLDSWKNYSGPSFDDMLVVITRSRDSDILADSNFESALERLGGVGKGVSIERQNHWACGWIEHVMVSVKAKRKAKIAFEIHNELAEYPVLDENDYSDRQTEKFLEFANDHKDDLAEALALHFGLKNGPALVSLASDLNMECQYYAGEDSCIDIYTMRTPSERDIKLVKSILEQMQYNANNGRTFKKLVTAVNAYQAKEA